MKTRVMKHFRLLPMVAIQFTTQALDRLDCSNDYNIVAIFP